MGFRQLTSIPSSLRSILIVTFSFIFFVIFFISKSGFFQRLSSEQCLMCMSKKRNIAFSGLNGHTSYNKSNVFQNINEKTSNTIQSILRKEEIHREKHVESKSEITTSIDENANNLTHNVTTTNYEMKRRYPKAIIAGFTKCGSFALQEFINLHPNITTPSYETNFFDVHFDKGFEWYRQQMPLSLETQVTIEKSPMYVLSRAAMERIRLFDPDIKLIFIIRNPVAKMQSSYAHYKAETSRKDPTIKLLSFEDFIKGKVLEKDPDHFYQHLKLAYTLFHPKQTLILCEEQLEKDPIAVLKEIETFLELPKVLEDSMVRFDADKGFFCFNSSHPRFSVIYDRLRADRNSGCFDESKGRPHEEYSSQLYTEVLKRFRPLNEKLFGLVGKTCDWDETEF